MKISKKILLNYIDKVSIAGMIPMLNLKFTEDGVKTFVKDLSSTAMTNGLLKKEVFEDYSTEFDQIFIKDSKFFINFLKTFNETIELSMDGEYVLKLSEDKRETYITLADKDIVTNIMEKVIEIEDKISVNITKNDLRPVVSDMTLLGINAVDIKKTPEELVFQVGKENEFDYTVNKISVDASGTGSTGVGEVLKEVFLSLDDNFIFEFGDKQPLFFIQENDDMKVTTTLAPRIEGDN